MFSSNLFFIIQKNVSLTSDVWRDLLIQTCKDKQVKLLILDPLVRLANIDENRITEMSGILSFLRRLQIECDCAVAVIHHFKKLSTEAKPTRSGQMLRGTGDLHALSDSSLFLHKIGTSDTIQVEVEHRESESIDPFYLTVESDPQQFRFKLDSENPEIRTKILKLKDQIYEVIKKGGANGILRCELEEAISCKKADRDLAIHELAQDKLITITKEYRKDKRGCSREMNVYRLDQTAGQDSSLSHFATRKDTVSLHKQGSTS